MTTLCFAYYLISLEDSVHFPAAIALTACGILCTSDSVLYTKIYVQSQYAFKLEKSNSLLTLRICITLNLNNL